MPILRNWSTVIDNPYRAPEAGSNICLHGNVYGHPRFEDGTEVTTSRVKESEGRVVQTMSGSEYVLEGEPDQEFVDQLEKIGYTFDPNNPIKKLNSVKESHAYKMQEKIAA